MNCCDEYGDCRQGRDCPVRVAKVGWRYSKYPEPFPESFWQKRTKALARFVVLGLIGWLIWVPLFYLLLRE